MKRSLALLLASVLLVFSLAACGRDQQPGGAGSDVSGSDNGGAAGSDNGGLTGGSADDSVTGGVNSGGDMMDGAMDTMDGVGGAAAVRGAGDALTGGAAGYTDSQMNGYTYDQMVQNGRVF